ncbi:hypothetical protein ACA910_006067 [Epithemia clementina (nom. ined.)]
MWTVSQLNDHTISLLQNGFYEDAICNAKRAIHLLRDIGCVEAAAAAATGRSKNSRSSEEQTTVAGPAAPMTTRRSLPLHEYMDAHHGRSEQAGSFPCTPRMGVVPILDHFDQPQQHWRIRHPPASEGNRMDEDDSTQRPSSMSDEDPDTPITFCMGYSSAFVFNQDFCSRHNADTAAILLFNLGLAYHLYAKYLICNRDNFSSNKKVQAALHAYKLSMTTLNQHARIRSALLTMALLVNMSVILSHLLRHSEATQCLEGLELCLSESGYVNSLEEEDLRFFCFHVTYSSQALKGSVAPAA